MELKDTLVRYNPWWSQEYGIAGVKRDSYLKKLDDNLKNNQVIFITGLRRVGKTTLIKQFISELINKVDKKRILFLSFDDATFSAVKIQDILDEYRKINDLKFEDKIYLFFDEIGYKRDFSRELKVINDNQNVKIYASGSDSIQLQDKKAFLTGRVFIVRVYPLDFSEFLTFKKISVSAADSHLRDKYFEEHLKIGGMPQYVLTNNPEFITSLIDDIIYKDIARAFPVKNPAKLKDLFMLLCERTGKRFTYNKLAEILNIDNETAIEYVSYFQKTFLFNVISRHSKSLNERVKSPKKIYIADNAIRNIFVGSKDKGSLFENYVFNELSKKFEKINYYFENEHEIDFVIKNGKQETAVEATMYTEKDLSFFEKSPFKRKAVISKPEDLFQFIK
jgi:predicted AAA+ superfamily ATPase